MIHRTMKKQNNPSVVSCVVEEQNDQMDPDGAAPVSANGIDLISFSFFIYLFIHFGGQEERGVNSLVVFTIIVFRFPRQRLKRS